ncbi:hypothetical protein J6590_014074 [Homalodisca vitripennis]|nr:hypothetical protein J6590_014074 [Homalodisca vitripennis]
MMVLARLHLDSEDCVTLAEPRRHPLPSAQCPVISPLLELQTEKGILSSPTKLLTLTRIAKLNDPRHLGTYQVHPLPEPKTPSVASILSVYSRRLRQALLFAGQVAALPNPVGSGETPIYPAIPESDTLTPAETTTSSATP